jgi:ribosome-binding factor A
MSTVKVYFTRLDEDRSPPEIVAALQHAAGSLVTELSAVGLRRMPKLVFALDKDYESGERVLWLLDHMDQAPLAPPAEPTRADGDADDDPGGGVD